LSLTALRCRTKNTDPSHKKNEINTTLVEKIDEKIASARSQLSSIDCLFCSNVAGSLPDNLTHMSTIHSFFIPDAEYLIDIAGLVAYLGEKVAVGNVCLYCNETSREFKTLDAVRKHMADKSHCKIAYDSEDDRLELSDFYDFSSSYPDADRKMKEVQKQTQDGVGDGWEDIENDHEQVDEDDAGELSEEEDLDSDTLPDNQITYGDSHLELVLPSGARIGHRSMRRYYAQSFPSAHHGSKDDPNSGAALVRRLLADKNSALIPRKGGFGAFGSGTEVVKARNRGEAREAGRHVREFRDQKRRENFKTKVAFIANSQKHFRDPGVPYFFIYCSLCLQSSAAYSSDLMDFKYNFDFFIKRNRMESAARLCTSMRNKGRALRLE
jgi:pre-60S factor REI1